MTQNPGDIRPQPGPQEEFCSLDVDFAIYGGTAGCGKSAALVIEGARYADDPHYTGVMFRRTSVELKLPGSIWQTAEEMYVPTLRATMAKGTGECHFPAGGLLKFSHLQYETNLLDHHSAQYVYIAFDEVQTFTQRQVFYMLTRNRPGPGCSQKPYMRAGCNPDADSWLRPFIDWWIDPESGYPIFERSGVVRYFIIENDQYLWVDKTWRGPDGEEPISFTFVPGKLDDNQILLAKDPKYRSRLLSQDSVTVERLYRGNWNITAKGNMFNPEWFRIEQPDARPRDMKLYRYWDMAATEKEKNKDPDYTAGVLGGMHDGEFWIVDATMWQRDPSYTEREIKRIARVDGKDTAIGIEEEKGSAGKHVMSHYARHVLQGFEFHPDPVSGQKAERALPWCALAGQGLVHLVKAGWNQMFKAQAASFPVGKRDMIDAASGVYKMATGATRVWPKYSEEMFKTLSIYSGVEEWKRLDPKEIVVLGTIVSEPDASVSGNYYIWSRKTERLWVYAEYHLESPTTDMIADAMRVTADIPIKDNAEMFCAVSRIIGNAEMFSGTMEDMAHQLRRQRIRVHESTSYDTMGMAMRVHSMMANGQITVGTRCDRSDEQYRSWTAEGRVPVEGFPHCIGLCMVVSELKGMGELDVQRELPAYSRQKMAVRERLRKMGSAPLTSGKRTGDEYLAA